MLSVQDPEQYDKVIKHTGTIFGNYYKSVGVQSKKGRAKNVTCIFCDGTFTGCSSYLLLLLVFLVDLFSDRRKQILKLVYQYVKMMIIGMHNSKLHRKFSTKK